LYHHACDFAYRAAMIELIWVIWVVYHTLLCRVHGHVVFLHSGTYSTSSRRYDIVKCMCDSLYQGIYCSFFYKLFEIANGREFNLSDDCDRDPNKMSLVLDGNHRIEIQNMSNPGQICFTTPLPCTITRHNY
jgi:hypothetical protein